MSVVRDPYDVLGVPRHATTPQIRAAYVARARLAHPDLVGRTGLDAMRGLNEAWDVLKDAERRQAWDVAHGGRTGTGGAPGGDRGNGNGASSTTWNDGEPFWTGAAGPPPGRASGPVLDFGIYAGWSLGEIARRDRGYLFWLRDRPEARRYGADLVKLLAPAADEPAEVKPRRR